MPYKENKTGEAMQINKTIETPEGKVVFEGTLEGPELDFIIQIGLMWLLQNGGAKFQKQETHEALHST